MSEDVQFILDAMKEQMSASVVHLETELVKVRAGKANPSMLDGVFVDYYGVRTPLNQVSNVNTPDARTLAVQPWEKAMIDPIMKAIQAANLGFNPTNNGTMVIISVPPLTEERRKDLVKKAKAEGENAKVSLRTARKEALEEIKQLNKLPEDEKKTAETKIQEMIDQFSGRVDKHLEVKEKEIMTV
ncbi:MAG: ribosome recycling factor [Bacteroidia bacterium]|nr:ribosome recycling factor [Bacteroidia bacterium]